MDVAIHFISSVGVGDVEVAQTDSNNSRDIVFITLTMM